MLHLKETGEKKFAFFNTLRSKFRKTFEIKVENHNLMHLVLVDFPNYIREFEVARAIRFFSNPRILLLFLL